MTKKITLPGQLYRSALRLFGAMVTFTFTLYMYASGQTAQVNQNKTDDNSTGDNAQDSTRSIMPIIEPGREIIALYGMPHADYSIKGTIRNVNSKTAIPNIHVSMIDTLTKELLRTTTTQSDGTFAFTFSGTAFRNSWIISTHDVDGEQYGSFEDKDTLATMTSDDFKNGNDRFYYGTGSIDVDINLSEKTKTNIKLSNFSTGKLQHSITVQNSNNSIAVRYSLDKQSRVAINLFSIDGKLVHHISDNYQSTGEHTATIKPSCLATGTYLLQVQTDSEIAVSKVDINR